MCRAPRQALPLNSVGPHDRPVTQALLHAHFTGGETEAERLGDLRMVVL